MSPARQFFRAILMVLFFIPGSVFAVQEGHLEMENGAKKEFDVSELILHHVMDDHIWHLWDHGGTIYLPVIVYSGEKGLEIFSSHHFYNEHHDIVDFNGYKLDHNHIYLGDSGKSVLDLSITKNVAMLLINAAHGWSL